jgi:hypothetical protein
MIKGDRIIPLTNSAGSPLIAVPSNVGPRTMPDYDALAAQGIYDLKGAGSSGIRVLGRHGRRSVLHRPGRDLR